MDIAIIVFEIVKRTKYPLLFIIFLLEGPIAGFISSMLSANGQFNIWIICILFFSAEIIADIFFFYIGKGMSKSNLGKRLANIDKGFLKEVNRSAHENFFKVLFILKVSSIFAVPGIIYLGNIKAVSDKRFIIYTTIICFFKDSITVLLGYQAGIELSKFIQLYNIYQLFGGLLLLISVVYLIVKVYKNQIKSFLLSFIKNKI